MSTKSRAQRRRERRQKAEAERRARTCPSGKTAYRDRITAETILARIQAQSNEARCPQRAYRCPTCRLWHLTSKG